MNSSLQSRFILTLTLRESIIAAFTAVLMVATSTFIRIPIHLPGHRVLMLVFFLLLGRACARPFYFATFIGIIAGLLALMLGHEPPAHLLNYSIAGVISDLSFHLLPSRRYPILVSPIAGGLIGASWVPASFLMDQLAGMDLIFAFTHSLFKFTWAIVFGLLGGILSGAVQLRLRSSHIIV